MGLHQLLGLRQQVVDNTGAPLAGGQIHIYSPNTTTRITSYSDSGIIVENTNPVILSGDGRASIWITRDADIRVEDAEGNLLVEELSVNPDELTGSFSSGLVPNGSFEDDANADDIPDGWTSENNAAGSNNGLDTTETTDGGSSWRSESTGSGGGDLVTTAFFPVNDVDDLRVSVDLLSTVATVRNIVRVEWYDVSQVTISDSDIYDSTANPLTWTNLNLQVTPPGGARFARIRILGGTTGGVLTGITYWDKLNVFYPLVVAGVFDNITIANNDIISTNTNGSINITPNGTGAVVVGGPASFQDVADFVDVADFAAGATLAGGLALDTMTATGAVVASYAGAVDLTDADVSLIVGGAGTAPHLELDSNEIQAKTNATTAAALAINRFGGDVVIGAQAGAGLVGLWAAGQLALGTEAGGVGIQGSSDDTVALNLRDNSAVLRGSLQYQGDDNLYLENAVADGDVYITVSDGGLTETAILAEAGGGVTLYNDDSPNLVVGDSVDINPSGSGGVTLNHAGVFVAQTTTQGLGVRSGIADESNISFQNNVGGGRGTVGFQGSDDLDVRNAVNGGGIDFSVNDGVPQFAARMFAGGGVELYYDGAVNLEVQDHTTELSGAQVRWRDGLLYDVARAARLVNIFANVSSFAVPVDGDRADLHITLDDLGSAVPHTATFNQDATMPVGAQGEILARGGTISLIAGTGVTLFVHTGSAVVSSGTVAEGGWIKWTKESATTFGIVGAGIS